VSREVTDLSYWCVMMFNRRCRRKWRHVGKRWWRWRSSWSSCWNSRHHSWLPSRRATPRHWWMTSDTGSTLLAFCHWLSVTETAPCLSSQVVLLGWVMTMLSLTICLELNNIEHSLMVVLLGGVRTLLMALSAMHQPPKIYLCRSSGLQHGTLTYRVYLSVPWRIRQWIKMKVVIVLSAYFTLRASFSFVLWCDCCLPL